MFNRDVSTKIQRYWPQNIEIKCSLITKQKQIFQMIIIYLFGQNIQKLTEASHTNLSITAAVIVNVEM